MQQHLGDELMDRIESQLEALIEEMKKLAEDVREGE